MSTRSMTVWALAGLLLASTAPAATITVSPGESIQAAIDAANPGDTVAVADSTYAECLDITKDLLLVGSSEDGTVIDATACPSYSLQVDGDITAALKDFTLLGATANTSYGIKAAGENLDITIQNVTVQDSYRSGVDVNGAAAVDIENVTSTGADYGVGIALTDCSNVVVSNVTTSDNAWAGMAIYVYGAHYAGGSDNVSVSGLNASEAVPLYTEIDDDQYALTNLNVAVGEFPYAVGDTANPAVTAYYADLASVQAAAAASSTTYIMDRANGAWSVYPGMSIQAAIDAADPGDTVNVAAGTYTENLVVPKAIALIGAGRDTTIVNAAAADTTLSIDGNINPAEAGDVLIQGFTFQDSDSLHWMIVASDHIASGYTLSFLDNRLAHGTGYGWWDYHSHGSLVVRGCVFEDVSYALQLEGWDGGTVTIEDNEFTNLHIWNYDTPEYPPVGLNPFTYGSDCANPYRISNNHFHDYADGGYGIVVNGGYPDQAPAAYTDMRITDNTIENVGLVGIRLTNRGPTSEEPEGGVHNAVVTGNAVTGCDTAFRQVGHNPGTTLTANSLVGDTLSIENQSGATPPEVLQASGNWFGSSDPAAAATRVGNDIDYSPWLGAVPGSSPMTWYTNDSIQDAIDAADAGDTVGVVDGELVEPAQIVIDKDITVEGRGKALTTVKPGVDTVSGSYTVGRAFVYIDYGVTATIRDMTIDCAGKIVWDAIQSRGADVTIGNCAIANVYGARHDGRGVLFLTGNGLVENCDILGFQRIGVHVRGHIEPATPVVEITGCRITGKGDGDWLDYAVEAGAGGEVTVSNCVIEDCRGIYDGTWGSAGLLATDYYGDGTVMTVVGSEITGNSTGIEVGYDTDDSTVVVAHDNAIAGNDIGINSVAAIIVDAENNWWGDATGPLDDSDDTAGGGLYNPGGLGDPVSDGVDYDPWLGETPNTDVNVLKLDVVGDPVYLQPTEDLTVTVNMDALNLVQHVAGCQAMLNFDSSFFKANQSDVSVATGDGVWDQLLWNMVQTNGDLDVAIGVSLSSVVGTMEDGTVAKVTLKLTGTAEGTTQLVFRPDVADDDTQQTLFSDVAAQTIMPGAKIDSQDIVIDGTAPALSIVSAEQGGSELIGTANNALRGDVTITVAADDTLAGLAAAPAVTVGSEDITATAVDNGDGTFSYTWTVDGTTPNGPVTLDANVADKSGNSGTDSATINVNRDELYVTVETGTLLTTAYSFDRSVTFTALDGSGAALASWTEMVTFVNDASIAAGDVTLTDVPAGTSALTADTDWTLVQKVDGIAVVDGSAQVGFTGTEKLRTGDLNNSNSVNVLDYAVLKMHWYTTDAVADFNGDGQVKIEDYNLLKQHWFQTGE